MKQDYVEAVKLYRKAAEQGNAYAQMKLGYCIDAGHGIDGNHVEAVKWYRKSATLQKAALQRNYQSSNAINLAEIYLLIDEYDLAVSCLDDHRLLQDRDPKICFLRYYLKACALLANGKTAEAEIRQFNKIIPRNIQLQWDTTAFQLWLKNVKLPDETKKIIAELTKRIDGQKKNSQ